ncbi:MAG: PASTA domain-containing protein [Pyrinomonadaceae bacterium]
MSIIKAGVSAISKLLIVVALAGTFLVGAGGVVYLSLRGAEVKVPEVVGKDFYASENEMAALGLKLKKRATRYSHETPNTVLEQLPKSGETVKTGQVISVVVSEANPEDNEAPATVQKDTADNTDAESTDITPDKPVKTNKNSNTKKPAQTTRDVISNKSNSNADTAANVNSGGNSNGTNSKSGSSGGNKNSSATPANKLTPPANSDKSEPVKPNTTKPPAAKTPATSGDTRTRKVP